MPSAENTEKKKKERMPHFRAIVVLTVVAALLLVFFLLVFLFRTRTVEVTGNNHETDAEVEEAIMTGPLSGNTLVLATILSHPTVTDMPFVESVTISATGRDSVRIEVTELPAVAYLAFGDRFYYFDGTGKVLLETYEGEQKAEEKTGGEEFHVIPCLEGLNVEEVTVGETLKAEDASVFSRVSELTNLLNKYEIDCDKLVLEEDSTWTLVIDKIKVKLGSEDHMDEKLLELTGILPEAQGLAGTLHLENFDGTQTRIIFDSDEAEKKK